MSRAILRALLFIYIVFYIYFFKNISIFTFNIQMYLLDNDKFCYEKLNYIQDKSTN